MTRNYKDYVSVMLTRFEQKLLPRPQITILGYHGVSNDKTIVDIEKNIFEKQLSFLEKSFTFVTLTDVLSFICGQKIFDKPAVALTFDDGYRDILTTVHPILRKKSIPATLFIMSDLEQISRKELANNKKLLSKNEILFLHKAGWEIGCHSATHANFADKRLDIQKEIIESKKTLEAFLHNTIRFFAYPKGLYTPRIAHKVQEAGFEAAFSFEAGIISQKSHLFSIPRTPVDATHTMEQYEAFFSHWGTFYLGSKQKWARIQQYHA